MMHFFFSSRRRHTRWPRDWSSDVCSSDLLGDESTTAAPEQEEENLSLPGQDSPAQAALNRGARKRSFERGDHSVPESDVEEWRFTPLRRFAPLFEDVATDDRDGDPAVDYQVEVPEGAADPATLAIGDAPRGTVLVPKDLTTAVASARTDQALHLVAGKNTVYETDRKSVVEGKSGEGGGREKKQKRENGENRTGRGE